MAVYSTPAEIAAYQAEKARKYPRAGGQKQPPRKRRGSGSSGMRGGDTYGRGAGANSSGTGKA